jgi:hypothetical protein
MPRPNEANKEAIKIMVREHLNIVGPHSYEDLLLPKLKVGRAQMFRYIKEVREEIEEAAVKDAPGMLRMAQKRIKANTDSPEMVKTKVKAHMPSPPSPAIIAADPVGAQRAFNFLGYFHDLLSDAEALRRHALVRKPDGDIATNPDGTVLIKNPNLLGQTIAQRKGLLDTYMTAYGTVFDAKRIEDLYNLIVDEVGKAAPDVQQAVLVRMRKLDNERGLTMNAVV